MKPFRYEALLQKIEVSRAPSEARKKSIVWEVDHLESPGDFIVLRGMFRVSSSGGSGRALVLGIMVPESKKVDLSLPLGKSKDISFSGCVEVMYDAARRNINMQAAQMDFTFDIPKESPKVKIGTGQSN